jgi:hypothetical protein
MNKMERIITVKAIYSRLAKLDESREEFRLKDLDVYHIDMEIEFLRKKVRDIMNDPILK